MTHRDREYLRCLARAHQLTGDESDEEDRIATALADACERLGANLAELQERTAGELARDGFFRIEATQ